MPGHKRFFNNLKDNIKLKLNNNIEINFRNLLPIIWPQLFSIIPKRIDFFFIPDSSLEKFPCFSIVVSILVFRRCGSLAGRIAVPAYSLGRRWP